MFVKFNELLIVLSMLRRPRFEALLFQRTAIQKLTSRLSTSGEQARLPGTLAEEQMSNQLRHISLGCIWGEGITRVYLGWCLSRYKSIQTCIYIYYIYIYVHIHIIHIQICPIDCWGYLQVLVVNRLLNFRGLRIWV